MGGFHSPTTLRYQHKCFREAKLSLSRPKPSNLSLLLNAVGLLKIRQSLGWVALEVREPSRAPNGGRFNPWPGPYGRQ